MGNTDRNGTFYLNNSGTRIVHYVNGKKEKVRLLVDGRYVGMRTVLFEEAFGNFGTMCITYKGKKYKLFPKQDARGVYVNLNTEEIK